jgi:hypothetical protein
MDPADRRETKIFIRDSVINVKSLLGGIGTGVFSGVVDEIKKDLFDC